MGGHAYIIPGSVRPDLIPHADAALAPRPAWRRMLGIGDSNASRGTVTVSPNGDTLFDIPAAALQPLVRELLRWLEQQMDPPAAASITVLEYLTTIAPTIYVRGSQRRDASAAEFYLQVSFSGCAGEAEVSARVAAHWTGYWWRAEGERLTRELLVPFGFTPSAPPEEDEPMFFLPAGDLGYLEYVEIDGKVGGTFEIDNAIATALEDDPRLEHLVEHFQEFMEPVRCRCQLCEPSFGDASDREE